MDDRANQPIEDQVRRDPACGPLIGLRNGRVARFLGVPFAQPPVGVLRYAAPQPLQAWREQRAAFHYGPTAAQPFRESTLIPEPEEAGDDILNLNVFAPAEIPGQSWPVLFYIHGGGYFSGCNRSEWYDGAPFVEKGVVVVTVGYRLGIEGFMPVEGAPDNRGMLDWIAALEWVHKNIAAFGGDPSRITIAGQSAGGGAVAALMAAPAAKDLFGRAVLFSGSIGFGDDRSQGEAFADRLSALTGRPATVDALAGLSRPELIAAYSALDSEDFATPLEMAAHFATGMALKPYAGTESLPRSPADAFAAGWSADVPVLLTATHEEFVFMAAQFADMPSDEGLADCLERLGLNAGRQAAFRDLAGADDPVRLLGQAVSDKLFRAPMMQMAAIRERASNAPTYVAEFGWPSPQGEPVPLGAAHCLDLPYYFDKLDLASARRVLGEWVPHELGRDMHQALVSFVRGEDPGWEPWNKTGRARIWNAPDAGESEELNRLNEIWPAS